MRNSIDNWLVYAHSHQFTNVVMAFAAIPIHQVFDGVTPKEQGPWLTPRSAELLDKLMRVVFDSKASHDAYQAAARHVEFVNRNKPTWAKVRVFDTYV